MNLSKRAIEYLESLNRNSDWVTSKMETMKYLGLFNAKSYEHILRIQLAYSGFDLTIKPEVNSIFKVRFISNKFINKNKRIYTERVNDETLFKFDNDINTMSYYITEGGRICTKDEDNPKVVHYCYDNFDTMIEQYALLNELDYFRDYLNMNWDVLDFENLKSELSNFERIMVCCDSLNFCCKNETVLIMVTPWLGGPGKYLCVYGIDKFFSQKIIDWLIVKKVVE